MSMKVFVLAVEIPIIVLLVGYGLWLSFRPLRPDSRPLDSERLARLREVGHTEGADLSGWYAEGSSRGESKP